MHLYHKDVFLPRRIRVSVPSGIQKLQYSPHAINAAKSDRYGVIPLTDTVDFGTLEIVEVEHNGRQLVKAVLRENGQEKNRVLVVMPIRGEWLVKTVWFNLANDKHRTLNRGVYEQRR